jgi:CSLREA domain-containing protein
LLCLGLILLVPVAQAAIVVNTNADTEDPNDGLTSLREAIVAANQTPAADVIEFNIDNAVFGSPPHTIMVGNPTGFPLPLIEYPTIFDGTSEPDYILTGSIAVVIDGANVIFSNTYKRGLQFDVPTGGSAVRGLAIQNFPEYGIGLYSNGNTIEQNAIETNGGGVVISDQENNDILNNVISGNHAEGILISGFGATNGHNNVKDNTIMGNTTNGISVSAPFNEIRDNVISGNGGNGILIYGVWAHGNVIRGNFIGTDKNGAAMGNGAHGITIGTDGTHVGGFDFRRGSSRNFAANVIANNGLDGVQVSGVDNTIRGNSIYSNADLGIDLAPAGPTPNDPQDPDGGANDLQNCPMLAFAETAGTATRCSSGLLRRVEQHVQDRFYANQLKDPSGFGEGETYLHTHTVTTLSLPHRRERQHIGVQQRGNGAGALAPVARYEVRMRQ